MAPPGKNGWLFRGTVPMSTQRVVAVPEFDTDMFDSRSTS